MAGEQTAGRRAGGPSPPPNGGHLDCFVGRDDLRELVTNRLARRVTSVIDCEGEAGIGKSQLLARIYEDAKAGGSKPAWMDISDRDRSGNRDQQLLQDDGQYVDMVLAIAEHLIEGHTLTELRRRVSVHKQRLGRAQMTFSRLFFKPNAIVGQQVTDDLSRSRAAITGQLAGAIRKVATERGVVVLMDNYHNVVGNLQLRGWLADLLQAVASAGIVVVVFRRPDLTTSLFGDSWRAERLLLPLLSEAEVREYLRRRLRGVTQLESGGVFALAVDTVMVFSGGHPLAMEAAVERAVLRPPGETVEDALRWLSACPPREVVALVGQMGVPDGNPLLARAFEAACVLRRFDAEALAAVMDPQDEDEAAAAGMNLATELTKRPGATTSSGRHPYAFHEFVRRQRLGLMLPGRRGELHARAADHYLGLARDQESETGGSTYDRFLRYDKPDWQEMESEWLYHFAEGAELVEAGEQPEVFVKIATIYLEVFWWWGCYIRYPFCEFLIRDIVYHARGAVWQRWAHTLRVFHRSYAPEQEPSERGDWDAVERALVTLRDLSGLGAKMSTLDETRRRLDGLTAVFMAHACWRRDARDGLIDYWYCNAYRRFRRIGEYEWCLPWVRLECAELERERGDPRKAAHHCAEGLRLAEPKDHEVLANLHRLRGDLALAENRAPAAAEDYAVAVFEAYVYQCNPHEPDEYTRTFYDVLTTAVLDELREATRSGHMEEVETVAKRLHEQWAPARGAVEVWPRPVERLVDERDWEALRPCIFPRGPSNKELNGAAAIDYASTVRFHITKVMESRDRMRHGPSA